VSAVQEDEDYLTLKVKVIHCFELSATCHGFPGQYMYVWVCQWLCEPESVCECVSVIVCV
jgi:hypothetical protein